MRGSESSPSSIAPISSEKVLATRLRWYVLALCSGIVLSTAGTVEDTKKMTVLPILTYWPPSRRDWLVFGGIRMDLLAAGQVQTTAGAKMNAGISLRVRRTTKREEQGKT